MCSASTDVFLFLLRMSAPNREADETEPNGHVLDNNTNENNNNHYTQINTTNQLDDDIEEIQYLSDLDDIEPVVHNLSLIHI